MYPNLTRCILALARDTYGTQAAQFLKPQEDWEWPSAPIARRLEAQASRLLTDELLETFVCGECSEVKELVAGLGLHDLHTWISEVFDGNLVYNFFS